MITTIFWMFVSVVGWWRYLEADKREANWKEITEIWERRFNKLKQLSDDNDIDAIKKTVERIERKVE